MNHKELISTWKAEESIAYIHGWDFSHISGRYTEQDDLPWDYRAVIGQYLLPVSSVAPTIGMPMAATWVTVRPVCSAVSITTIRTATRSAEATQACSAAKRQSGTSNI